MSTYALQADEYTFGKGWEEIVRPASPAAGAIYTYTVAGDAHVRVLHARWTLTTDANAANRLVTVQAQDADGNVWAEAGAGLVVTASTTNQRFVADYRRGVAEWAANTPVFQPLFDYFIQPGYKLVINVASIQVGDQLSAISLLVQKFGTGPRGYQEGDRGYLPRPPR